LNLSMSKKQLNTKPLYNKSEPLSLKETLK